MSLVTEEEMVVCAKCQEDKPRNQFYSRKNGKPLSYCMNCQKEVKELKLQENLERIVEERGGACADCGGVYPMAIYEFYHEGKVYQISRAKNMSYGKIKEKLDRHAMLCRNCSAIRKWELG